MRIASFNHLLSETANYGNYVQMQSKKQSEKSLYLITSIQLTENVLGQNIAENVNEVDLSKTAKGRECGS